MAKKRAKQTNAGDESGPALEGSSTPTSTSASTPTATNPPSIDEPNTTTTTKKRSPSSQKAPLGPTASPLLISRNKHWRYVSNFQGPWLQLPIEILQTIANINYNTLRPRPIDAATLFDLVKSRRLVDEATNLAVRAASDIASPTLTNVHGGFADSGRGSTGSIHGGKLSRERKFRMREQASQKLAQAYRLDEIVCSVAMMQGSSAIQDLGKLVLQRNADDPDAKYVNFFHEKIPSRQVAESTSLESLSEIISERPTEPEVLRTRATIKVFKNDLEGAAQDLTYALSVLRFHRPESLAHKGRKEEELRVETPHRARRRPQDVILEDKDQPSSFEGQVLFHRASAYLAMACELVPEGLPAKSTPQTPTKNNQNGKTPPSPPFSSDTASPQEIESRKSVKLLAKRALRDFMAFIGQFEYSPDFPMGLIKEFNDRINAAMRGVRKSRASDTATTKAPPKAYSLADLFAAVPPSDLPPYPSQDVEENSSQPSFPADLDSSSEFVTFHPLLSEALHNLLLCHCLVQTSPKELQRHAYMVARLVRLCDGYPVFKCTRSIARSDWMEVLRGADNWLNLFSSWDTLCASVPIPMFDIYDEYINNDPAQDFNHKGQSALPTSASNPDLAASAAKALASGHSSATSAEEARQQRVQEEARLEELRQKRVREKAVIDACDDDRVIDEESFRAAILARQKRAEADHAAAKAGKSAESTANTSSNGTSKSSSSDGSKDSYLLSERASAIALWVREAPIVTGTAKRKKRTKKTNKDISEAEAGVASLDLHEAEDK